MKAYEDSLYEQWRENVEAILPSLLKRNLLVKPSDQAVQQPPEADEDVKRELEAGRDKIRMLSCALGQRGFLKAYAACEQYLPGYGLFP